MTTKAGVGTTRHHNPNVAGREAAEQALTNAGVAIDAALKLGHRPRVDSWRKLSGRMWATVCSECGREVWLIGPGGGWTYGGSAIREAVS